jgi:2-keto-3-deoxy-L-rhamnonate aldolase RhmA
MIETIDAVRNIDKILAVPGLDGIFIGKVDLSATMGVLPNYNHPDVLAAVDMVLNKTKHTLVARGSGRAPDPFADVAQSVRDSIREGYNVIPLGSDDGFIKDGTKAALSAFRSVVPGSNE